MKQLLQLTLTLTFIAALSGLAVSYVNKNTKPIIAIQKSEKEKSSLKSILPTVDTSFSGSIVIEEDTIPYWISRDSANTISGYAFKTKSGKGYSSKIEYIIATSVEGEILGLSILSQAETPGLGARVTETISSLTIWSKAAGKKEEVTPKPWFTEQFKGLTLNRDITVEKGTEWHKMDEASRNALLSNNNVTAITGATITTQAVANSISDAGKTIFPKIITSSDE